MNCIHEFELRDGSSQNDTYKIEVCKKCSSIGKVLPRGESPKVPKAPPTGLTIGRMSVIKSATELALREDEKHPELTGSLVELALVLAETLETWVYRPVED